MMSSTKPEVHNASQHRQTKIATDNMHKIGEVQPCVFRVKRAVKLG